MSRDKRRDHDEEQGDCQWKDSKKVWVEADEGVSGEEGECLGRISPSEQAYELILKNKDDAYACVEATEVVGHQREAEGRSLDMFRGSLVDDSLSVIIDVFGGDDLLQ